MNTLALSVSVLALGISIISFLWTRSQFRHELRLVARYWHSENNDLARLQINAINPTRRDMSLMCCGITLFKSIDDSCDIVTHYLHDENTLRAGHSLALQISYTEILQEQKGQDGVFSGVWVEDESGKRHPIGVWADMLPERSDDIASWNDSKVWEVGRSGSPGSRQSRKALSILERKHRNKDPDLSMMWRLHSTLTHYSRHVRRR